MFSGRHQLPAKDGRAVIEDRRPVPFGYMLEYLQSGEMPSLNDPGDLQNLREELDYWCIPYDLGISNIITSEEDFNYFNKKLAKGKSLKLIFRLTRDGSESGTFHDMCDHIKNTITLIMSEDGNIFGGYASVPWTSELGYKKDDKAYLFSLAQQRTELNVGVA